MGGGRLTAKNRVPTASIYVYPWSLADLGVEAGLKELKELGFEAFELTSNYHPIAAFSPRTPNRYLMYLSHGAVLFPARLERYGRIKPHVLPDSDIISVWPRAAEVALRLGLILNAWTIGLFQPWIVEAYPDCARVLPSGGVVPAGVCPASPDVREYLACLVQDLSAQFPIQAVQLEGIGYPAFGYGWVRPRVLVEIGTWSRWLLGLCFCLSCRQAADAIGLDFAGLQKRVVDELRRGFEASSSADPLGKFEARHPEWLDADTDYAAFIHLRNDVVIRLLKEIAATAGSTEAAPVLGVWGPHEAEQGQGVDLRLAMPYIGLVKVDSPLEFASSAASARELANQHGSLRLAHVQHSSWPSGVESAQFDRELQAALRLPVDQVSLFTTGLLRPGQLEIAIHKLRSFSTAMFE